MGIPYHFRRCCFLLLIALFCAGFRTSYAAPTEPMLATVWDDRQDPAGWWVSEKYDGVRGLWDGQRMLSRSGRTIQIPVAWQQALPAFALDGELWAGHGRFEAALATVRDRQPGPGWAQIRYMVFDSPSQNGSFEKRMAALQDWATSHAPAWLVVVTQRRCRDRAQLRGWLRKTEALGGEGLMLRAAESPYVHGRSPVLQKYKSFQDTEATVVGYNPGHGKYREMVGSLQVRMADGRQFSIGSGLSDTLRRHPPALGSVVTFKYFGLTANGLPRFPVYWRERNNIGDTRKQ